MAGDCCNCSCDTGRLPYTLTVNASGFEKCSFASGDITILSASTCFGSGALVRVTTNYDYPNQLKMLTADVLEPGSGYAIKGRVQPTIELTAPTLRGADCTYTPTFTQDSLECSECYQWWALSGGTVDCKSGGSIPDGVPEAGTHPLTVRMVSGMAQNTHGGLPVGRWANRLAARYHRAEPTLTASLVGGGGAVLAPVLQAKTGGWAVASVTVSAGGTGYIDGQAVQFSTPHLAESPAAAVARTFIAQPQMAVSVRSFASGQGAALSATMSQITVDGRPRFVVSGVTIQSGGSGYAVGDEVRITTSNGQSAGTTAGHFVPPPRVSSVSGSGAVSGISFNANNDCTFWRDTGVVESVAVTAGGAYCLPIPYEIVQQEFFQTAAEASLITDDTRLWAEDDEAEPCVASPWAVYTTALDESHIPCTVSTNTEDGTFGQVVSAEISDDTMELLNDGSTYPYYRGCIDGEHVLFAEQTSPAVTFSVDADYGDGAVVLYGYGGTECSTTNHIYQQRVAPAVTASNGVIATLEETADEDGLPAWTIASLAVAAGCAADGAAVAFTIGPAPDAVTLTEPDATLQADENNIITGVTLGTPGLFYRKFPWGGAAGPIPLVTVEAGGSGYAVVGREEPQAFTFSPAGPWTPTLDEHEDDFGRPYWSVASIAVGDGGGFTDGQALTLAQAEPEFASDFKAVIRTERVQPTITASIGDPAGTGATLAVTLEATDASPPNETWRIASVEVTKAGSGYFTLGAGISFSGGVAVTEATATPILGANGTVVGVEITNPGEYWGDSGVPDRVEITQAGRLWRENTSLPAHVANVTIAMHQASPSDGTGAELSAFIDDDPTSETFGELTAVTVVDGGSGYVPFVRKPGVCKWRGQCPAELEGGNGGLPVSQADFNRIDPAISSQLFARTTPDGRLIVGHVFPYVIPAERDYEAACETANPDPIDMQGWMMFHYASAPPEDCSSFSGMATSDPNTAGTFSVATGGVLSPEACLPCFTDNPCASPPPGLTATISASFTVPAFPEGFGGLDLPDCLAGEWTLTDLEAAFSCDSPDVWLTATGTMTQPAGAEQGYAMTCTVEIGCEGGDVYLTVTFTAPCAERYEDGEEVLERELSYTTTISPIDTTTNEAGFAVPDDITDLDITFVSDNTFPASISITFTENA